MIMLFCMVIMRHRWLKEVKVWCCLSAGSWRWWLLVQVIKVAKQILERSVGSDCLRLGYSCRWLGRETRH